MANMIVEYKVMPKDSEIEYENFEKKVKEIANSYDSSLKITNLKCEEIGFGIKACRIKVQLNEKLGSEELEERFKKDDSIGNASVEFMDRL